MVVEVHILLVSRTNDGLLLTFDDSASARVFDIILLK